MVDDVGSHVHPVVRRAGDKQSAFSPLLDVPGIATNTEYSVRSIQADPLLQNSLNR